MLDKFLQISPEAYWDRAGRQGHAGCRLPVAGIPRAANRSHQILEQLARSICTASLTTADKL
jgi:hypothetical protein